MYNIISKYISTLTKEDIIRYARINNLTVTKDEIDFLYNFIKTNYKSILANPDKFNLDDYKDKFSSENFIFLQKQVNKYKRMII